MMKVSFSQPADDRQRYQEVEAQCQRDLAQLADFFAEASETDKRFEYEAKFYARRAEDARKGK